jgi:hypothetical protein
MSIPNRINLLLKKRTRLAIELDNTCDELDTWLDENNITAPSEDTHGGVEIYANPKESELSVRNAIKEQYRKKSAVLGKQDG